jgi:hypothetical protein
LPVSLHNTINPRTFLSDLGIVVVLNLIECASFFVFPGLCVHYVKKFFDGGRILRASIYDFKIFAHDPRLTLNCGKSDSAVEISDFYI